MNPAKRVSSEQGVAMIAVIGVIAAVTLVATAALMMSTASLRLAGRQKSSTQAIHVAEAGLNTVFYEISEGDMSGGTGSIATGEFQTTVAIHPNAPNGFGWYIVKSTGYVPNIAAVGARKRAVEAEMMNFSLYDFLYTDANAGKLVGNATIDGPVYVNDIFALSGTGGAASKYLGGPLFIKDDPTTGPAGADCDAPGPVATDCDGDLSVKGDASVGEAGNPVGVFMEGQIIDGAVGTDIFADPLEGAAPSMTFPLLDIAYLDNQYRSDSSTYVHDDDGVTNMSTDLELGQTKDAEYLCLKNPTDTDCKLEWEKADKANAATLSIDGTVFVDGKIKIGAMARDIEVTYDGVGTLVSSGEIALEPSGLHTADYPDGDFLTTDVLGFVTVSPFRISAKQDSVFETVVYAKEESAIDKKIVFYGSLATGGCELTSNPTLYILPASQFLPPSMPEMSDSVVSLTSWKEVAP